MNPIIDLVGQKFGRLVVLSFAGTHKRKAVWNCQCDCGKSAKVESYNLRRGCTSSCGCLRNERIGLLRATHRMSNCPEYSVWTDMKKRCCNPKHKYFDRYGGRGIIVCEEWRNSFEAFFAYVGPRPSPNHEIDRYPNNDGNYEPGNVRWATKTEQARHRSSNRIIEHDGVRLCLAEWSERVGIPLKILSMRIGRQGWTVKQALEVPVMTVKQSAKNAWKKKRGNELRCTNS